VKRLPLIGERCPVCGGWVSRACACGGRPDATTTLEGLARHRTAVDRDEARRGEQVRGAAEANAMRRKRPAMFHGDCVENGATRRLTKAELQEASRLYRRHSDIRLGRVQA
jgi:hypothetical protein